jgi:hypothetical protein
MHFLLDSARGVYLPQSFAICYDHETWGISPDDHAILLEGPEAEYYWEAWESVLNNARFVNALGQTYYLWLGECGDLFSVSSEELENIEDDFFDITYNEEEEGEE